MKHRRRVVWVVAVLVLGAAGFAVWWLTQTSPLRDAYDHAPLGITEAEALQCFASVPADDGEAFVENVDRGEWEVEWEGYLDGSPRRLSVDGFGPRPVNSFLWWTRNNYSHERDKGVLDHKDRTTRQVVATERQWFYGRTQCNLLFDLDGRLVEKRFASFQVYRRPPWEKVRDFIADRWPF